jgi:hypothetical protein
MGCPSSTKIDSIPNALDAMLKRPRRLLTLRSGVEAGLSFLESGPPPIRRGPASKASTSAWRSAM